MKKAILLSALLLGLFAQTPAQAEPKYMGYWWRDSHWVNQDFKPYYQEGTLPQQTQWENENWQPEDWVQFDGGNGLALIEKWYRNGIIYDQYVDNGAPYLDVGVNFYHLSGFDKKRIMATVDHVYGVTRSQPGMFYLKDHSTEKVIGYYTPAAGLILE